MSKAIDAMKEEGWEVTEDYMGETKQYIHFVREKPKPNAVVDFYNFQIAVNRLMNYERNAPNIRAYELTEALNILLKAVQRVEA